MFTQPKQTCLLFTLSLVALCELAAVSEETSRSEWEEQRRERERTRRVVTDSEPTLSTLSHLPIPHCADTHTHTSTTALLAGALRQPWCSQDQSWDLSGKTGKSSSWRMSISAVIAEQPALSVRAQIISDGASVIQLRRPLTEWQSETSGPSVQILVRIKSTDLNIFNRKHWSYLMLVHSPASCHFLSVGPDLLLWDVWAFTQWCFSRIDKKDAFVLPLHRDLRCVQEQFAAEGDAVDEDHLLWITDRGSVPEKDGLLSLSWCFILQ